MNINARWFADSIRLLPSGYSFLLLEGETDEKLFANFIDEKKCRIKVCPGKDKKNQLVETIEILNKENYKGVIAIVDADFWIVDGKVINTPNLLHTDTHDIETMIIKSDAFDKFLSVYGSDTKLEDAGDVRQLLLTAGMPIGYLRWVSEAEALGLSFKIKMKKKGKKEKGISFKKFINNDNLMIDESEMIRVVISNSKGNHNQIEIAKKVETLKNSAHDPWQVCCGHDLVEILSIGLTKLFATYVHTVVAPVLIGKNLRLAFSFENFKKTQLYKNIKNWEGTNSSFQVLSQ